MSCARDEQQEDHGGLHATAELTPVDEPPHRAIDDRVIPLAPDERDDIARIRQPSPGRERVNAPDEREPAQRLTLAGEGEHIDRDVRARPDDGSQQGRRHQDVADPVVANEQHGQRSRGPVGRGSTSKPTENDSDEPQQLRLDRALEPLEHHGCAHVTRTPRKSYVTPCCASSVTRRTSDNPMTAKKSPSIRWTIVAPYPWMPYAPALSMGSRVAMYERISSSLSCRNVTDTTSTAE